MHHDVLYHAVHRHERGADGGARRRHLHDHLFSGHGHYCCFLHCADVLHQQLSHQAAQKGTRPLLCTGHGKAARCAGFVFETLFTAIACLALGLVFGVLFSKLLFMALLYLLDFATPLAFSVSVPSLVTTVVLFACIYGATLLYNMVHIRLANPVELLHGGQKGEKEPKTSWLLTFCRPGRAGRRLFYRRIFQKAR